MYEIIVQNYKETSVLVFFNSPVVSVLEVAMAVKCCNWKDRKSEQLSLEVRKLDHKQASRGHRTEVQLHNNAIVRAHAHTFP